MLHYITLLLHEDGNPGIRKPFVLFLSGSKGGFKLTTLKPETGTLAGTETETGTANGNGGGIGGREGM